MNLLPFIKIAESFFWNKNTKILWFQLLKCKYFLLSFVFYDCTLNIFRIWAVCQNKTIAEVTMGFGKIRLTFKKERYIMLLIKKIINSE